MRAVGKGGIWATFTRASGEPNVLLRGSLSMDLRPIQAGDDDDISDDDDEEEDSDDDEEEEDDDEVVDAIPKPNVASGFCARAYFFTTGSSIALTNVAMASISSVPISADLA